MTSRYPQEYDFFRAGNRVLRVFGSHLVDGQVAGLIRYWREDPQGIWTKPPVYGGEEGHPESMALYDSERVRSDPHSGLLLGFYSLEEIDHIMDPISTTSVASSRDLGVAEVITALQAMGIELPRIGVGGSRLLGIEKPTSDIDILVTGCPDWRPLYEKIRSDRSFEIQLETIPLTRLIGISRHPVPKIEIRAFQWLVMDGKEIDLHMISSNSRMLTDRPIPDHPLPLPSQISTTKRFGIESDTGRHLYPTGHTAQDLSNGRTVRLMGHDHVLHLVMRGDIVTAKVRSGEEMVVVERVYRVDFSTK